MAEIVYLDPGNRPPNDTDWVTVTRTPSGSFDIVASKGHARGVTFSYGKEPVPLRLALDRATAEADRLQISHVYVEGVLEAERFTWQNKTVK